VWELPPAASMHWAVQDHGCVLHIPRLRHEYRTLRMRPHDLCRLLCVMHWLAGVHRQRVTLHDQEIQVPAVLRYESLLGQHTSGKAARAA
jgi:hypothetical protein